MTKNKKKIIAITLTVICTILLFYFMSFLFSKYDETWKMYIFSILGTYIIYLSYINNRINDIFFNIPTELIKTIRNTIFATFSLIIPLGMIYVTWTGRTRLEQVFGNDLISKIFILVFSIIIVIFVIGFLTFGIRIKGIPKILTKNIFWNILLLVYFFSIVQSLYPFNHNDFISIYIVFSAVSILFIIRLLKNRKDILLTNSKQVVGVLLFITIFILNIFSLNLLLYMNNSDAFNFATAQENNYFALFYYTITNVTSVGFGDIAPKMVYSQITSIITSIFGYVLLFTIISNLIISSSNIDKQIKEE